MAATAYIRGQVIMELAVDAIRVPLSVSGTRELRFSAGWGAPKKSRSMISSRSELSLELCAPAGGGAVRCERRLIKEAFRPMLRSKIDPPLIR